MAAVLIPAACLRIAVIGSTVAQDAIDDSPQFAASIDTALRDIISHLELHPPAAM